MQHFTKQKRKGDVRLRGAGATDKRSKKIERVKKRNWRRSVWGGGIAGYDTSKTSRW